MNGTLHHRLTRTVAALCAAAAGAVENAWVGAPGESASRGANWSLGHAPGADEVVRLDGRAAGPLFWDGDAPRHVAGWTQDAGFTGTISFATSYPDAQHGFTNLLIAGDCLLRGGAWTHPPNDDWRHYRLAIRIGGRLEVGPAAVIDVSGCGYAHGGGPGHGPSASHGGQGNSASPAYGRPDWPEEPGSGGAVEGLHGGGAVLLEVAGEAQVEGTVAANGMVGERGHGGPAGGSIVLVAARVAGAGTVAADGAAGMWNRNGGGGRVLLRATAPGAVASSFGGRVTARGGGRGKHGNAAAGTVCLQDADGRATLLIDNEGVGPAAGLGAPIPAGETWTVDRLVIRKGGILSLPPSATLALARPDPIGTGCSNGVLNLRGGTLRPAGRMLRIEGPLEVAVDAPSRLACDVELLPGARVIHTRNGDVFRYGIDLTVEGNLTIANGAAFHATGAGYGSRFGPGACGSHGGEGDAAMKEVGPTYGSILMPETPGSGSPAGGWGGGVVRLVVSGMLTVDGAVEADGGSITGTGGNSGGGSGGSVWIEAERLAGRGRISACGASGEWHGMGGGGRVAVYLTEEGPGPDRMPVLTAVSGGKGPIRSPWRGAAAGTVFVRSASDRGRVIVDNGGVVPRAPAFTPLPPHIPEDRPEDLAATAWSIRNAGWLLLTTDVRVESLTLEEGTRLELGGKTLTVSRLLLAGREAAKGTHTTNNLATPLITGAGSIVVGTGG